MGNTSPGHHRFGHIFVYQGLIVASVTNTMQETQMINNLIWMGFSISFGRRYKQFRWPCFPIGLNKRIALFIPAQYLATGLESAATKMAAPRDILEDVIALGLGLFVAFEVSRNFFRWEPEAKVPGRAKLWVLAAIVPFLLFGAWENTAGHLLGSYPPGL